MRPIRVVVADHDPISRHVVTETLGRTDGIDVVACVDSHRPLADWPPRLAGVAVLSLCPGDSPVDPVRVLAARSLRVLLIGVAWTRAGLDGALAAGATGCLVKTAELTGLAGAVHAVAGGNRVLSPELLDLYVTRPAPAGTRRRCRLDAVRTLTEREREVVTLLAEGLSTAEVARFCRVSRATVKSHVSHALGKLGARNRLEAVLMVQAALTAPPAGVAGVGQN
jgi:DNA-binding NarL/FixJ family response regulator